MDIVTDFLPFFEFVVSACLHFSMLRVESSIGNNIYRAPVSVGAVGAGAPTDFQKG